MVMKRGALLTTLVSTTLAACGGSGGDAAATKKSLSELTGVVQKGPFINGTSITVSELDASFVPTGRSFNSAIADNSGSFTLRNVELSSPYVELKADGFYFNEVSGDKSASQLTLYALSDLSAPQSVNVNILSHLEKSRVEQLMSEHVAFEAAKQQAQHEILNVFSLSAGGAELAPSEQLSISAQGDGNAALLAISVILQGYRSTAELSELLADINTDLRKDGTLDSESTGTKLVSDASLIDLAKVRENLVKRYDELGIAAQIPAFEAQVEEFLSQTHFKKSVAVDYPKTSNYGENILAAEITPVSGQSYSMAANLRQGMSLKVVLSNGLWGYQAAPNGPVNWSVTQYDRTSSTQTFTVTESGKASDLSIQFTSGTITMDVYENQTATPSWSRTFTVQEGGSRPTK